mmetsp:Transcript_69614/g.193738  ORF Transcript_69614/g.193738 Transcript_69614/m.193738 type:complete len:406 (-) Transcript_69614:64-1281(-)
MGRMAFGRGDTSNVNKKAVPSATFDCSGCGKRLPRSAFAKAELSRGGASRCRDCAQRVQCGGCSSWLLPAQIDAKATCRKCRENVQVDRLLKTPKDEVTHFGIERVLQLDRQAEHEILFACQRCGISERMVLQRILDFLRVPYVATHNGMHFCELCDTTFGEVVVNPGQRVRMATASNRINWAGCPGPRLVFSLGDKHTVAELRKASNDRWFLRALAAPLKPPGAIEHDATEQKHAMVANHFVPPVEISSDSACGIADSCVHAMTLSRSFESFWAPLDATVEGQQPPPLMEHLASSSHKFHEAAIAACEKVLVSRAAISLARKLGEEPVMALSRFRAGLGLEGRFCEPRHFELAAKLERVRDANIPVKFLRDALPARKDFLWITSAELWEAEEKYEQRRKRGIRK